MAKPKATKKPKPSRKKKRSTKSAPKKNSTPAPITKHQQLVNKHRAERAGMTIAQCVALAIRNAGKKKGLAFKQIHACLTRSGIQISNFILKNTLNKMIVWKVLKKSTKWHYKLRKSSCPSHLNNKHVNEKRNRSKAQRVADQKFLNKMNRVARKIARGDRTMEQCVVDALRVKKKRTFKQLHTLFQTQAGMQVPKHVLKHVVGRLREKHVIKIYRGYYMRTGKKMPARKNKRKVVKT